MVCIVCFDVFMLIRFLQHSRYSSEVIKLVNNCRMDDISFAEIDHTMRWLKIAKL